MIPLAEMASLLEDQGLFITSFLFHPGQAGSTGCDDVKPTQSDK